MTEERDEEVRKVVRECLKKNEVDGVLTLKRENCSVAPHLFKKDGDVSSLTIDSKYPIALICRTIHNRQPDIKIAVVVRGCDERALIEQAKRNQVNMSNLTMIGVACTRAEAETCGCSAPYPSKTDIGTKVEVSGIVPKEREENLKERLDYWKNAFSKCIKCYGCRNICPVCMCDDCMLEKSEWVSTGTTPPDFPAFHLIRAYHVADKCIECWECDATCPVKIPLKELYRLLLQDVKTLFNYEPGKDVKDRSPIITTLEENPINEG